MDVKYEFLAAFDNGGETADRFRVVFEREPASDGSDADDLWAFNMSDNGVCMTTDYAMPDAMPGEVEIAREALPEGTRKAIAFIEAERYTLAGDRIA